MGFKPARAGLKEAEHTLKHGAVEDIGVTALARPHLARHLLPDSRFVVIHGATRATVISVLGHAQE